LIGDKIREVFEKNLCEKNEKYEKYT